MEQNSNIIECNYDPCLQCCKPHDKDKDVFADIDVNAVIEGGTTERVRVDKGENSLTFIFSGLKGQLGDPGDSGTNGLRGDTGPQGPVGKTPTVSADATVVNSTGDAKCRVTTSGTPESPVFHFTFSGIKGLNGTNGADGKDGKDGKDGSDGSSGSYDDSEIRDLIEENSDRITDIVSEMGENVKNNIESLLLDANWVQLHARGIVFGEEESEGATSNYLSRLGFWDEYEDPETHDMITVTKFSKLEQDIDSIDIRVSELEVNQQVGGEVDYSALSAALSAYLDENGASAGFNTYWGKLIKTNTQQEKQLIEWMASAAESYSTAGKTFANILSSAENVENLESAYAGLQTMVETINDDYVSTASITSSVRNEVTDQLSEAGIITESNLTQSMITLFAQNNSNTKNITGKIFAIANADGSGITIDADNINLKGHTWADVIGLSTPESVFDNTYHTIFEPSSLTISSSGNKVGSKTTIEDGSITFTRTSTPGTLEGGVSASGFYFPGIEYQGMYGDHGNLICNDTVQAGSIQSEEFKTHATQGNLVGGASMVVPYTYNNSLRYMIFCKGLFIGTSSNQTSASRFLSTGEADGNITRS